MGRTTPDPTAYADCLWAMILPRSHLEDTMVRHDLITGMPESLYAVQPCIDADGGLVMGTRLRRDCGQTRVAHVAMGDEDAPCRLSTHTSRSVTSCWRPYARRNTSKRACQMRPASQRPGMFPVISSRFLRPDVVRSGYGPNSANHCGTTAYSRRPPSATVGGVPWK